MALISARYPQSRPITSITCARWSEVAVSFMRSMASSAVFRAVSTPMAMSAQRTSLSTVAGIPTTFTPSSASLKPPVRLPSPPMTASPSTPACDSASTARSSPSGVVNSLEPAVPSTVPPPVQDASHHAVVQRVHPAFQQSQVLSLYPHDLPAPDEGRTRHRPHRGVHARSISPARQYRYPQGLLI
jgi:hypothetical protein